MATDRDSRSDFEAMLNPKTALDWVHAALYPQSPYNQLLTECLISRKELCEIIQELLLLAKDINAKDEAEREARLQKLMDKIATKKLLASQHDLAHERPIVKEHPVLSLFELQAQAEMLEKKLAAYKSKLPALETAVASCKHKLNVIDQRWQKRQADQAAGFVVSLNDQLLKNAAGFSIKMKPSVAKRLEQAYITASPAKILAVNPTLAESPAANVELMTNMSDFTRQLKVLSAINHLMHDPEHQRPEEDFFPLPSKIKELQALVKIEPHDNVDVTHISQALAAKQSLMSAQHDMRNQLKQIHETEKSLNKMHDEIRVLENKHQIGRGAPAA